MNNKFKKVISIYLSIILSLGVTTPATLLADDAIIENCVDKDSQIYFPVSDERGNMVQTKKETNRECTLTKKVQGACIKWSYKTEDFTLEADNYNSYRSVNHQGAMGSMLAMIGAYDQLEHLWSGWRGYCEIGTKTNFDWASDPMFWAGLLMSGIMDSTATSTGSADSFLGTGSNGFLSDTSFGQAVQGAQTSMGEATQSVFGSWAGAATSEAAKNIGKCLMAGGFDMSRNLYSALTSSESDDMCDPVDEFCGNQEQQTEESDIMTMDQQQYDDLIAQNPDYEKYLIILDKKDGVLSVRYKKVNEMNNSNMDQQEQLDALKEKMKKIQIAIGIGLTTIKMATCVASGAKMGSTATGSYTDNNAPLLSVKNGLSMATDMIPAQYLGPYGALIKAAMQILINFLYSFKNVDTCNNQDDADEAGARHAKTCQVKPHNLCHFIYDQCVDNCGDSFFGMAKELRGYNYCCYDQILTKVLVVQLKAQLGRDWTHCSGISLRDLNYVSFRQCSAQEMKNGIDGGKSGLGNTGSSKNGGMKSPENGGYDPKETFQYKNKCIDLTEFKDYLEAQIGSDIDLADFNSIFEDLAGQNSTNK